MRSNALPGTIALLLCTGIGFAASPARVAGDVDAARLQNAAAESQNWFAGGRDIDGTYFSPLATIDDGNVKNLGFAWTYDLGNPQRGQEATPIVVDGVMYTSGTWGYVYAVDARERPANYGATTPRRITRRRAIRAATWSTAASRCGKARSMLRPSMAGCTHSMPRPARRSGPSTRSMITRSLTRAPARRRLQARSS